MSLIPVTYDVPAEIALGLETGKYKRFGSIIRGKSRFVTHLKEIAPNQLEEGSLSPLATGGIVVGGIAIIGGATYGICHLIKKIKVKKLMKSFYCDFQDYCDAIQNGSLCLEILNRLEEELDDIQDIAQKGIIKIDIIPELFIPFKTVLAEYTKLLAEANHISYNFKKADHPSGDNIVDIKKYIQEQRKILEKCV